LRVVAVLVAVCRLLSPVAVGVQVQAVDGGVLVQAIVAAGLQLDSVNFEETCHAKA
jgi:hypothetical protein